MKIENFSTTRLRNAELVSLAKDVLGITKAYDWAGLNVLGIYTSLETSLNVFVDHLNKLGTVKETNDVEAKDELFNNAWRAFKYFCIACELHPNKTNHEAAVVLIELSRTHGYNLHQEGYQAQIAKAQMFLNDCDTLEEAKKAILDSGAKEYLDNVKDALTALVEAITNRKNKSVSEKRDVDTKELRVIVYQALDKIFKYIEVMADITPEASLSEMGKKINESIQKLEISQKLRSTRNLEVNEQM